MTTTETAPTKTAGPTAAAEYKNPVNWFVAAICGPLIALVLVGGMKVIPVWADYTIVAAVSVWRVHQAIRWWNSRASSAGVSADEPVREPADVV